ncbi:U32 family peptidase [Thermodesulfobacteriota bacterium]
MTNHKANEKDNSNSRVELLAPAGNFEKLKVAIHYGADAVYVGGKSLSLRAQADNFSIDGLKYAAEYAQKRGVKLYVVVNAFMHNNDLPALETFLTEIKDSGVNALIMSDPGAIAAAKEIAPAIPIHISTQANVTNKRSAKFWEDAGAKRVIVARELSLEEIAEIKLGVNIEVEAFVHGAMCISYSGRCLLSNFMTERDSNRGHCAHPCRWNYHLVEEKRPGEYYKIEEDERGTYVFNSKDLCMIEHIPELIGAGVDSLKIEGRMKGINYVASAVLMYRKAIDAYLQDPGKYEYNPMWLEELKKISHRGYTKGFFFGDLDKSAQNYSSSSYIRSYDFVGIVKGETVDGMTHVQARNKIIKGDRLEVYTKELPPKEFVLDFLQNTDGEDVEFAQPLSEVYMKFDFEVNENDLIRREIEGADENPLCR